MYKRQAQVYVGKDLNIMKEIFQEYGGILITVVSILSIILVVTAVIGLSLIHIEMCIRDRLRTRQRQWEMSMFR